MYDPLKPNIVLLTCDQLRAFEVSCYGNKVVKTPNIDALASRGVRFDLAVTNNPVCTPARSCMLSGQYSRTCAGMLGNVHRNPPNPERQRLRDQTLPETLKDAGYDTALIGKWHIGPQPQLVGFSKAIYPMVAHRHYGQTYFNEEAAATVVSGFGPEYEFGLVEEYLRSKASRTAPFFLNYNISPPHQPIGPGHMPDEFATMYDPEGIPIRPNARKRDGYTHDPWWFSVYRSADFFWRDLRGDSQDPKDIAPEDFDLAALYALYYGAISYVDSLVGRFVITLAKHGLMENTVILFTSDHGDNLGSHGLFNKNALIEESIRIPFVIVDPRVPHSGSCRQMVSLIDVMPTLLTLSGIEPPPSVQGQDLSPLVHNHAEELRDNEAFIETGSMIGIRTPAHLYGIPFDAKRRIATSGKRWLYDLTSDPYQMSNLSGSGSKHENELHARLMSWNNRTPWLDAPEPTDPPGYADRLS